MTIDEFVNWTTDDGLVRLKGVPNDFLLVKARGEDKAPVATREQYENFECSYAHAYADTGAVMRFRERIADIRDLVIVRELPN